MKNKLLTSYHKVVEKNKFRNSLDDWFKDNNCFYNTVYQYLA